DTEHPGRERRLGAVRGERREDVDEHFLGRLFDVGAVVEPVLDEAVDAPDIALVELIERLSLTRTDPKDQLLIADMTRGGTRPCRHPILRSQWATGAFGPPPPGWRPRRSPVPEKRVGSGDTKVLNFSRATRISRIPPGSYWRSRSSNSAISSGVRSRS